MQEISPWNSSVIGDLKTTKDTYVCEFYICIWYSVHNMYSNCNNIQWSFGIALYVPVEQDSDKNLVEAEELISSEHR